MQIESRRRGHTATQRIGIGRSVGILFAKGVQGMFGWMKRNRSPRRPARKPVKIWSFRPSIEVLEDRLAPAVTVYTVTSLTDTNPGGGGNGAATSGDLRYCITQANLNGGSTNDIVFGPNASDGTLLLNQALPPLQANVNINGPGAGNVTIQRANGAPAFSIFTVTRGVTDSINGLTIENGLAGLGGGINNQGTLTLNGDDLLANTATGGGAVYNADAAFLYGDNLQIIANQANTSGGGGISNAGTLELSNSSIWGNTALSLDGGGYYSIASTASAVLNDVAFWNNVAAIDGGGVAVESHATFTMHGGALGGNTAGNNGGGLYNFSDQAVTLDSGVGVGNNQALRGGGLYLDQGTTTTFGNVTVGGNSVKAGGIAKGIYLSNTGTLNQQPGTTLTDNDDPGGKPVPGP
jgi:hypothetical protein